MNKVLLIEVEHSRYKITDEQLDVIMDILSRHQDVFRRTKLTLFDVTLLNNKLS